MAISGLFHCQTSRTIPKLARPRALSTIRPRRMFNLLPKDTVFFDLFEDIARHIVSSAEHLRKLTKKFPDISGEIQSIRDEEHAADEIAHKALDRLDRTFITPFDREDIHELVGGLDDIIDGIDALAKRFPL